MSSGQTPGAGKFRPVPERNPDFSHLSLEGLRAYRRALNDEEGRVSYWRRIIQARLDLVRAPDVAAGATTENLKRVLTDPHFDSRRKVLLNVVPVDDIPPLPDLAELWARQPEPGDPVANRELAAALARAEGQLSAYRTALHRRLNDATNELIARYRDAPLLCLSALPQEPVAVAAG